MNDFLCCNQFSQGHPDISDGGREAEDGAGQVCPRGGQRGGQDQAHLRPGLQSEGQILIFKIMGRYSFEKLSYKYFINLSPN